MPPGPQLVIPGPPAAQLGGPASALASSATVPHPLSQLPVTPPEASLATPEAAPLPPPTTPVPPSIEPATAPLPETALVPLAAPELAPLVRPPQPTASTATKAANENAPRAGQLIPQRDTATFRVRQRRGPSPLTFHPGYATPEVRCGNRVSENTCRMRRPMPRRKPRSSTRQSAQRTTRDSPGVTLRSKGPRALCASTKAMRTIPSTAPPPATHERAPRASAGASKSSRAVTNRNGLSQKPNDSGGADGI